MKNDELKALLKKAAEISKAVDDSLREAAFHRAVDVLLGNQGMAVPHAPRKDKSPSKPKASSAVQKDDKTDPFAKDSKRRSVGPTTALKELISEGYFNSPKRIANIQSHLKHKKGLSFPVTHLSTPLVRLLRNRIIDRTQAEDGQYEYKKA